ncbi:MAG: HAD hydrolase family protein [Synergistaceae bacterium]|nr:HAD hydrolase family protein [Synergistaceae bacterium]
MKNPDSPRTLAGGFKPVDVRIIFFSDLDNTLIHSYKNARIGDICVETRNGRALSYISPNSYKLLRSVAESVEFVPVTTRSVEQYRRLSMLGDNYPRFALVCNGAILLKDGEIDGEWADESRMLFEESIVRLPEYKKWLEGQPDFFYDTRLADDFFIFAKRVSFAHFTEALDNFVDHALFDLHFAFKKVYIMPKGLTKGAAVTRFMRTYGGGRYSVSAGDSELDLSMLEAADRALAPRDSRCQGLRENFELADGDDFCEFVLTRVKELIIGR